MPRERAVVLAGGQGSRLKVLTVKRAKPAVPFGGKYRIIDFALSNCVNSGIFDVLVLTQYRPHSLNAHIGRGGPWDLDRSLSGGVMLLQPYEGRLRGQTWYTGTADAVYQNISFVGNGRPEVILVLSGDHIYSMDYEAVIEAHRANNADLTLCTIEVPMAEASRFGIVDVDKNMRVKEFIEKPENPPGNLANMGVYVFNYAALEELLIDDAKRRSSSHDFGKDILPRMVEENFRVFAYPYSGYWVDVGTIDAYWESHMHLLNNPPPIDLNDRSWVIHTRSEEQPPVRIQSGAIIRDSLLTDGTIVAPGALVERSVLSPGVYVGPNAVVRESVILTDSYIEAGAKVERAIIDKICVIGHSAQVGRAEEHETGHGLVVIGKNTYLPAGLEVEQGVMIGTDLRPEDFTDDHLPAGTDYMIR